jgi:hypothetical protein
VHVKHEPKKFSCPDCSWLLDGSEGKCPKCGKDLSDEFALQCPICGASVSSDSSSCAECGAKFDDEGTPTPTPAAQPLINELEDFAATVKTSPPTKEPEEEPETPASIELPITSSPEEPSAIEPPMIEPTAPEVAEPETPVEVISEQPPEATPVESAAPKTKKRKLKSKSSVRSDG